MKLIVNRNGERVRLGRSQRRPRRWHRGTCEQPAMSILRDSCVTPRPCSARGRAELQPGRLRSPFNCAS